MENYVLLITEKNITKSILSGLRF